MDFDLGQFTLSVEPKTAIKPSDVRGAVNPKFEIPSIEVDGLVGAVRKDGERLVFKAKASDMEFELIGKHKAIQELATKLGEGKSSFKVGGQAQEEKRKDAAGKEIAVLQLQLTSAAVVETK